MTDPRNDLPTTPCPKCGGEMYVVEVIRGIQYRECDCGYSEDDEPEYEHD